MKDYTNDINLLLQEKGVYNDYIAPNANRLRLAKEIASLISEQQKQEAKERYEKAIQWFKDNIGSYPIEENHPHIWKTLLKISSGKEDE